MELTTAITLGFACAFLFPYYIKNKVFTIPEFLELRYNRSARTFFSGLMLIISVMTKLAFTLFAGALVLNSLLGWNIMTTVFYIGLIVAIFTIIGGFTAVAYTDTIQAVIIIGGAIIMLFIGLDKVGGWAGLMEQAPEAMSIAAPYDDAVYPFWGILATAFYAGIFYWGIDQVNVQRTLAAPNLKQARWGAMFAVFLKLFPVFIFALPGVMAWLRRLHEEGFRQALATMAPGANVEVVVEVLGLASLHHDGPVRAYTLTFDGPQYDESVIAELEKRDTDYAAQMRAILDAR